MKRLFQDAGATERLALLKDNCVKMTRHTYMKGYQHGELQSIKDGLLQDMIDRQQKEEEWEARKEEHREAMKPLNAQISSSLNALRDKARTVTEDCFIIANHEDGTAEYYNSDGEMVYERPLEVEERQEQLPGVTRMPRKAAR